MVERCRRHPDEHGLAVGLGGMPNDFAGVVLAVKPATAPRFVEVEAPSGDNVPTVFEWNGAARCEAATLGYGADGHVQVAPLLARVDDGARIGARPHPDLVLDDLAGTDLVGSTVELVTSDEVVWWRPV
jgi:hypothetical protein